jgi:hypothetical protein
VKAMLALAGFIALVLAPAHSAAGAARPRVALSVSPAQLTLPVPGSRTIKLRNDGDEQIMVDVTRRTAGVQAPKTWLQVVPGRASLRSGESAVLTVRAKRPQRAEPGDHQALVLLTTRAVRGGRVDMQLRLGVRIRMRVPGRIVRRVEFGRLRVHRHRHGMFILVSITNRGNVTAELRGHVTARLARRSRQVARLKPLTQVPLLPGVRAILTLRCGHRVRGPVTAIVRVRLGPGVRVVERRYRLRL